MVLVDKLNDLYNKVTNIGNNKIKSKGLNHITILNKNLGKLSTAPCPQKASAPYTYGQGDTFQKCILQLFTHRRTYISTFF
jgi:hypothetical protein